MKRARIWALATAAIVFPVVLATAAYFISTGVGASAGVAPGIPGIARDEGHGPGSGGKVRSSRDSTSGSAAPTPNATSIDDHGDRCSEPEHSSDDACSSDGSGTSGSGSDSSGKGSGDSGSGGGDSHSGSGSSGKGSGDS